MSRSIAQSKVTQATPIVCRTAGECTRRGGAGLRQFVEREFREFLTCSLVEHGMARFRCEGCAREHLVPFSCKGRGWCPSCGGRRMTGRAAHLVDAVLPWVPVRQWVLTVPYRLRYQMAWNHGLSRAVLGVHARVLLDVYTRGAQGRGIEGGQTGMVTALQRAGSGLNVNLNFSPSCWTGCLPKSPGARWRFIRRRRRATPRSRRRSRRSAAGCTGCWRAAAWSPPTTRRGRRIGSRTSPPCWRGSSGPRCTGGWRWARARGRECDGSAPGATRRP
ncbi:MAG: hypothetical protein DME10_11645 [Candidatus Rokuibacteriota bacterium]|nr:MAG: hypothetical protein DME10_11645 [Candidatus Rokubacteria bacterium]